MLAMVRIPPRCSGALFLLPLVLCGCVGRPAPQQPAPIAQDMTNVLSALDAQGMVRFPMVRAGSVLPAELEQPMSWHWQGPLDRAVRIMAARVNYAVVIPPTRAVPIVRIDRDNTTAAGLLDELAAAADERARIDVDVVHHSIEITWNA